MNRKLALVLTVVIFAAIAFCFLRPTEFVTYGEFGNIKPVYVEGDLDIPFTLSGDTDLLTVTKLELDFNGDINIYLKAAAGRKFTMGTKPANFATDACEIATVERYQGGKWVHNKDIDNFIYTLFSVQYKIYPSSVTDAECPYSINLPYVEPGKYRLTFNFREYFGEDKSYYCESDDTIHHITMEYEVPKASDSRYDVLYVHTPCQSKMVHLAIRANDGAAPFRRYDKVEVEQLVDGKYSEDYMPLQIRIRTLDR